MILKGEAATEALAQKLASSLQAGDVVTLSGPVGAGKTSLVRFVLHALGHQGEVPSPTFSIIQPYDHLAPPVWHADLYRIEDSDELQEIGLDELASDAVLLVEWPERAGPNAFGHALDLRLEILDGDRRRLTAIVPPAWEERWPPQ